MKWEDTVLHEKGCMAAGYITGGSLGDRKIHYDCTCGRLVQAEISYKAGIKEVMEWIKEKERMTESVGVSPNTKHITVYAIDDDEWQQFMESIGE